MVHNGAYMKRIIVLVMLVMPLIFATRAVEAYFGLRDHPIKTLTELAVFAGAGYYGLSKEYSRQKISMNIGISLTAGAAGLLLLDFLGTLDEHFFNKKREAAEESQRSHYYGVVNRCMRILQPNIPSKLL
jgi:thiol:disulfide interchange protein